MLPTYFFFGLQAINGKTIGNAGDMAKTLAKKGEVVYYLNPFPSISLLGLFKFFFKRTVNEKLKDGVHIIDAHYYPPLPNQSFFKWLRPLHRFLCKRAFSPVFKALKSDQNTQIIIDNEFVKSRYLKSIFNHSVHYYMRDYLLGVDYWKSTAKLFEVEVIQSVDTVLTNSPFYSDYALKLRPDGVHYIGQGVDFSAWENSNLGDEPAEYKNLKKPIVLYVGLLSERRLDLALLEDRCAELPYDFVLIGPESEAFAASRLHQCPNVHFLGSKAYKDLAPFLAHARICMNPQILNPITQGNYPRKLDEYFYFGKPVVQLDTQGIQAFKPLLSLYSNPENFMEAFAHAEACLQDPEFKQKAIDLAKSHSWAKVIEDLQVAIHP